MSTVPLLSPGAVPTYLHGLVDDAAIFPPGNTALERALTDRAEHQASTYADLVGPFVISDERVPELLELLGCAGDHGQARGEGGGSTPGPGDPGEGRRDSAQGPAAARTDQHGPEPGAPPLPVSIVVTGGAGTIEPAVRWAARSGRLEIRAFEASLRDEGDLPRSAARVVAAFDQVRDDLGDAVVHIEPPLPQGDPPTSWFQALDVVAEAGHALKFRTGGVEADYFRGPAVIATCIDAALDRETPFKCTAGLHHALPHFDEEMGVWQHGFLGILLGTRAALDGASLDEVAAIIAERDSAEVVRLVGQAGDDSLASARRWFTSFGCCAVREPYADLVELGLVRA
ncbi:MAG: hypothetical protein QM655_09955 [Nocardioidaceae bacterium]